MATVSELTSKNIASAQANVQTWGNILVNVKVYGAKGDGVTNDTFAINAAKTAAVELATSVFTTTSQYTPVLYFPAAKGYLVDSAIIVPKNISVIMDAPILYNGTDNITILTVGSEGGGTSLTSLATHKLNVFRINQSDWVSENSISIKIINHINNKIKIVQARGSTIGAQFMGSGYGVSYNLVELGIVTGKIGVDLTNENVGWCNENIFFKGQFAYFSDASTNGKSRYGVRITSKDGTYTGNNNNVFYKPSFEINNTLALPNESIPVLIEHGLYNRFYDCRAEAIGSIAAKVENAAHENLIDISYRDIELSYTDTSTKPSTVFKQDIMRDDAKQCIFNSGALYLNTFNYNAAGTIVNTTGVHYAYYAEPGTFNNSIITSGWVRNKNYLEGSTNFAALGVYVKTDSVKRFVLRKDCETGFGGRVLIVCYDANGQVLTNAGANHPYVRRESGDFGYSADFEGAYITNSDSTSDLYFKVHDDVKTIRILLTGGTTNIRIRSFSLYSLDGQDAAVYTGLQTSLPNASVGTAVPTTTGTFDRGKLIMNNTPASAGYIGWVCDAGGTFGTLTGVTGGITSGTRALTVNDATDLQVGQYITIVGVTGVKKIVAIAGLVVTIDADASATVSGAAIAYSAPTFKTWGLIS